MKQITTIMIEFTISDSKKPLFCLQDEVGGVYGCGDKDGTFTDCSFNSPQGVCWRTEDELYVADTENHTIRKVSASPY